jgi:hypothetical protein
MAVNVKISDWAREQAQTFLSDHDGMDSLTTLHGLTKKFRDIKDNFTAPLERIIKAQGRDLKTQRNRINELQAELEAAKTRIGELEVKPFTGVEPEPKPINLSDEYMTRDGREAEVFMIDNQGQFPVLAAYRDKDGFWWPVHLTATGRYGNTGVDNRDLVLKAKPRVKRTYYVNLYSGAQIHWYTDEAGSKKDARERALAVAVPVHIDVEEGFGK